MAQIQAGGALQEGVGRKRQVGGQFANIRSTRPITQLRGHDQYRGRGNNIVLLGGIGARQNVTNTLGTLRKQHHHHGYYPGGEQHFKGSTDSPYKALIRVSRTAVVAHNPQAHN